MALLFKDGAYQLIGACFEVYNETGCGFLESVYQERMEFELSDRGIPFVAQPELLLVFKKRKLKQTFKLDFVCFNKIVIEIKAAKALADQHRAQVHHYLKATGHRLGLLVNFGSHPDLEWERIVR